MRAATHGPETAHAGPLQDGAGRVLRYLRLSITDRCNLRCVYCLPDGCAERAGQAPLTVAEIGRAVAAFADLGFRKVRLTGGEPMLRRDVCDVVRRVAATPGIERVGLTTNGHRLAALAPRLRAAGLTSVNVSLDSLDPDRFRAVTGASDPSRVRQGVEAALAAGIPRVKVNVVLLRGLGEGELRRFLEWTGGTPVTVRFIDLMETGENGALFRTSRVPAAAIRRLLDDGGWRPLPRAADDDGPATVYGHPDHRGRAGIISAYDPGFCDSCNRLRVSSAGALRLCLFGDEEIPLRPMLQRDADREALAARVRASIARKPPSHLLQLGRCGSTPHLAATGG